MIQASPPSTILREKKKSKRRKERKEKKRKRKKGATKNFGPDNDRPMAFDEDSMIYNFLYDLIGDSISQPFHIRLSIIYCI